MGVKEDPELELGHGLKVGSPAASGCCTPNTAAAAAVHANLSNNEFIPIYKIIFRASQAFYIARKKWMQYILVFFFAIFNVRNIFAFLLK